MVVALLSQQVPFEVVFEMRAEKAARPSSLRGPLGVSSLRDLKRSAPLCPRCRMVSCSPCLRMGQKRGFGLLFQRGIRVLF